MAAGLVVLSLALITVYFREPAGGGLHDAQSVGASALRPFEVAVERVARPFRDAYGYTTGLVHAKSENERLKAELDRLRQQVSLNLTAQQENATLKSLLDYRRSPDWPAGFDDVAAQVISQPDGRFNQRIVVSAGSTSGVRQNAPVVTEEGLVGKVTKVMRDQSQVTLLTDETSAVSAVDPITKAPGIVQHGKAGTDSLEFDRVTKDQVVEVNHPLMTAGWSSGELESDYPKGIPIGVVTGVKQHDTETYKTIQVAPFVDFSSLDAVLILVPDGARSR